MSQTLRLSSLVAARRNRLAWNSLESVTDILTPYAISLHRAQQQQQSLNNGRVLEKQCRRYSQRMITTSQDSELRFLLRHLCPVNSSCCCYRRLSKDDKDGCIPENGGSITLSKGGQGMSVAVGDGSCHSEGCMKELRFLLKIAEVHTKITLEASNRCRAHMLKTREAVHTEVLANLTDTAKTPQTALALWENNHQEQIKVTRSEVSRKTLAAVLREHGLSAADYRQLEALRIERNARAHPVMGPLEVASVLDEWKQLKFRARTKNFQKRELVAEEILENKELLVDYDRRRNSNREALTKLKKDLAQEKKVWVSLGDLFVKMPKQNVETMIKRDQGTLDANIDDIRVLMKEKVVELEKLEGGDGSKARAFQLKGITQ
ncbi:p53 and DNA damage-regulated protein 1 [Dissophora globulifera]|uniref:P53 and DNA damage-regulated protein 1 n=1 Tax=Dissophora globulifera TaxID=979702 RepID=A0A9P6RNW2_9FUNG|nr:p53 and DNA damage-regulated protein 1 [Dissophora globulifera]